MSVLFVASELDRFSLADNSWLGLVHVGAETLAKLGGMVPNHENRDLDDWRDEVVDLILERAK